MQQILSRLKYEVGSAQTIEKMTEKGGKVPFSEELIQFLNAWSRLILKSPDSRNYPDVVTFAFWIRKANVIELRDRFMREEGCVRGRGVAFHIAPSNVAVNYAYSLVTGLLTGNANIVRIPSKEFPQVMILNRTLQEALETCPQWQDEICLVRYGHDPEINDTLSQMADARIIWGGDGTIGEIRRSPLKARAFDICFADRYSLAVIDVQSYLQCEDKQQVASDFYNDTYLTDQNACTSPRVVIWHTCNTTEVEQKQAADLFWQHLWELVSRRYELQPVQAVDKLMAAYLVAAERPEWEPVRVDSAEGTDLLASDVSIVTNKNDNRLMRIRISGLDASLMGYRENSGFFYEYSCDDLKELLPLCGSRCQTIGYLGDAEMFASLLAEELSGVDRIVPIGKTMDFDLIWDGYNLYEMMTRRIANFFQENSKRTKVSKTRTDI